MNINKIYHWFFGTIAMRKRAAKQLLRRPQISPLVNDLYLALSRDLDETASRRIADVVMLHILRHPDCLQKSPAEFHDYMFSFMLDKNATFHYTFYCSRLVNYLQNNSLRIILTLNLMRQSSRKEAAI